MPAAIKAPWEQIKRDFLSGKSATDLSRVYGVKMNTIAQRAKREAWKPAAMVKRTVHHHVAKAVRLAVNHELPRLHTEVRQEVREWVERSRTAAALLVSRVTEEAEAVPPRDLAPLASALDSADRVGRRALGLDQEQRPGVTVGVMVGSFASGDTQPVEPQALECESEVVTSTNQDVPEPSY